MKFQTFTSAIAINLICLLMLSSAQDLMELNWSHKDEETVFTFRKVQRIRDSLKFEIEAHNRHSTNYKCFYVASSEKSVHIDDDLGDEYMGQATVEIQNNSTNKLAINQRKTFTLSIPAPRREVGSVNLHLGLYARGVGHRDDCQKPVLNWDYNFHRLNWDVSPLR